ncbi:24276_t:CDS:2 [Gigaspora rosea]|nr:24276_t:CDS:2 [Gigaspora rosea]
MQEDSRTAIENVQQMITKIRPTLDEDCFFDYDIPHLDKRNLSKDDNTIMVVDSNNVLQNDNYSSSQGENNKEERNVNIVTKVKERMETKSNITIEGDKVTETQETRQISYSEAIGRYKGKRKGVTQCLDNGWTEEVKRRLTDLMKKEKMPFDCKLWGYDKIIEAFENSDLLTTLIKHKILTTPY